MTKSEAVHRFVERDLACIPQDWVRCVAEHMGTEEIYAWPAFSTMFMISDDMGSEIYEEHSKTQEEGDEDLPEEMASARVITHQDGTGTNMYLYTVDGHWLIGVHAYGFSFYDGVWDNLYNILGYKWHDEEVKS